MDGFGDGVLKGWRGGDQWLLGHDSPSSLVENGIRGGKRQESEKDGRYQGRHACKSTCAAGWKSARLWWIREVEEADDDRDMMIVGKLYS